MALIIDGEAIRALVLSDGIARQATADDGTEHMLFLDGAMVRSCLLADWPAEQIILAQHEQARVEAQALRQKVITMAQTTVGVSVDNLTTGQVKALVAILLHKEGALDKSGLVRPLLEWVK